MAFNSHGFVLVFLPVVVAGFWLLRRYTAGDAAIAWLILASLVFYAQAGWMSVMAIAPMMFTTFVVAKLMLSRIPLLQACKGGLTIIGVLVNIGLLGYFKYQNFFLGDVEDRMMLVVLPLGISFLAFQNIAFIADVKAGQIQSVNARDYVLFSLFFPKVIAGPIAHYDDVVPQFRSPRQPHSHDLIVGLFLFSVGLFKKTVIADQLSPHVDKIFTPPPYLLDRPVTAISAWVGVLAYTFQLYFDFSGYSDMALGAARMFGVKLPANFNSPLKSRSIVEFWSRWHITLTRFLTDYVYTPLMLIITRERLRKGKSVLRGRRSSLAAVVSQIALPTVATMLVSGIWHGVGWSFIVWGTLHGVFLTVNQSWRIWRPTVWPDDRSYERFMRPLGSFLTLGCVILGLVFFRASSIESAVRILRGMIGENGFLPYLVQLLQQLGMPAPWQLLPSLQPVSPILLLICLGVAVLKLPNSLELVQRYEPALGFSPAGDADRDQVRSLVGIGRIFGELSLIRSRGLLIGPLLGIVIGGVVALAFAAIGGGGAFIYGRF